MEKSYLHLENRAPEDVQRELAYCYFAVQRLMTLQEGSIEYVAIFDDLTDRMRGFRNYFSQDLTAILKDVKDNKSKIHIPQLSGDIL